MYVRIAQFQASAKNRRKINVAFYPPVSSWNRTRGGGLACQEMNIYGGNGTQSYLLETGAKNVC
jgi:hypothetical protein